MEDQVDSEVEIEMNVSDDQRVIDIQLRSTVAMDTRDLILALESYLTDLSRAALQVEQPGVEFH